MTTRLTANRLTALGACEEAIETVRREWPDGATLADIPRALALGLDVTWLLIHHCPAPALEEYYRDTDTVWAEYYRATATARAEYDRAIATALTGALVAHWPHLCGDTP